jgi:hypothetical protein
VSVQQKAEREARLADKKAKKEEDRRKKFAKKVRLSLASDGSSDIGRRCRQIEAAASGLRQIDTPMHG